MKKWLFNRLLIFIILNIFVPASAADQNVTSPSVDSSVGRPAEQAALLSDLQDHKAEVFDVEGAVKIMKKGTLEWYPVTRAMMVEEGDQMVTGESSYVEISYDRHFLNVVRIGEKTKAEFRSIEPTDLHLEDGTIFSALDGLTKNSGYQISTPTAVAAVRGTHFDVTYNAQDQSFFVATLPVPEDDHESRILLTQMVEDNPGPQSEVLEGFQIMFSGEDNLADVLAQKVSPEILNKTQAYLETMADSVGNFEELREEGKRNLMDQEAAEGMSGDKPDNNRKPHDPNYPGPGGPGPGPNAAGSGPMMPYHTGDLTPPQDQDKPFDPDEILMPPAEPIGEPKLEDQNVLPIYDPQLESPDGTPLALKQVMEMQHEQIKDESLPPPLPPPPADETKPREEDNQIIVVQGS